MSDEGDEETSRRKILAGFGGGLGGVAIGSLGAHYYFSRPDPEVTDSKWTGRFQDEVDITVENSGGPGDVLVLVLLRDSNGNVANDYREKLYMSSNSIREITMEASGGPGRYLDVSAESDGLL